MDKMKRFSIKLRRLNFSAPSAASVARAVLLSSLSGLAACSTTKSFRSNDCEVAPSAYGQCAVEAGLPRKQFEKLASYCSSHSPSFDLAAFDQARSAHEKELCSTPKGVFELQFRSSAGINGSEACPKEYLTSNELKKASEDGKAAAFAYSQKDLNDNELAHAQQRRFNADRNGYDIGLSDRTALIDTRPDMGVRDTYRNQFEKIIDSYNGVVEQELISARRCSPNGKF